MERDFDKLKAIWQELGEKDPLWAVVSTEENRGGKWKLEDFLKTGEEAVAYFHRQLKTEADGPDRFSHVLDFGCGVGRLCLPWSRRAGKVTGVDISAPMLETARKLAAGSPNIDFVLNQAPDLKVFPDNQFDLVGSHICLQHMPWEIAAGYVREFGRVCRPGGWVAFQLPVAGGTWMQNFRRRLVDSLPFGLSKVYRQWRRGLPVVFDMHYTAAREVERVAASAGLRLVHKEPDVSAGPGTQGFLYLFRK